MAGTKYYANIESKQIASDTFNIKGQSNQKNLSSAFSASPIVGNPSDGEVLGYKERLQIFKDMVMDGEVLNGNGFAIFNRDYIDAPNISKLDIERLNLPSPYTPNPTSPGPGSLNAEDKPAFSGDVANPDTINQFGAGNKSTYNPAVSSEKLGKFKLGMGYLPGDSGGN
jgi:hypothetical protein